MSAVHQTPGLGAPGHYASTAPEAHALVTTGAGAVASVYAHNKSGGKLYAYVYDSATAAAGVLIAGPFPVESHGCVSLDNLHGIAFSKGLFVSLSTSDAAYAADAGADGWFNVDWTGV